MSDENAQTAADPGVMFIPRVKGGKWHVIRLWSESVMNDHRLTRAAIKVAWGITQFLDDHARYYERRTLLAKRIGMADRTLDKAIALLTEHRHIVASSEWVKFGDGSKKLLTVTRPRFAAAKGNAHSRHPSHQGGGHSGHQGGGHSGHQGGGHSGHQGGGHSGHPCNQTLKPDHETAGVEDMAPGSERPEAEDVFDEEIDLPF